MTLTALELKLWHKMCHFENSPKQVVHPNFFLMASTFDIGGGPRSKKTWSQTVLGGCTVTLFGPWTITAYSRNRKYLKVGIFVWIENVDIVCNYCLWLVFPEWKREIVTQPSAMTNESIVASCKETVLVVTRHFPHSPSWICSRPYTLSVCPKSLLKVITLTWDQII